MPKKRRVARQKYVDFLKAEEKKREEWLKKRKSRKRAREDDDVVEAPDTQVPQQGTATAATTATELPVNVEGGESQKKRRRLEPAAPSPTGQSSSGANNLGGSSP